MTDFLPRGPLLPGPGSLLTEGLWLPAQCWALAAGPQGNGVALKPSVLNEAVPDPEMCEKIIYKCDEKLVYEEVSDPSRIDFKIIDLFYFGK